MICACRHWLDVETFAVYMSHKRRQCEPIRCWSPSPIYSRTGSAPHVICPYSGPASIQVPQSLERRMSAKPVRAADHVECRRNPSPVSAITPCTPEARANSRPTRAAIHVMRCKNRIPHPHECGTGRKPAWALSLARNPGEIEEPYGLLD
jgi:hypothetical protein